MAPRLFPVLFQGDDCGLIDAGCPVYVPWALLEPHEEQALRNHSQTLQRLAERGGLSPREMHLIMTGRGLRHFRETNNADAVAFIKAAVAELESGEDQCQR